jgi:HEAT repeats
MLDWLMLWGATQIGIAAIIQNWKDNPETLPYLKYLTQYDDWDVEGIITKTVEHKRQNNPNLLPWLKDNWDFRCILVKSIAQWWQNDPETLPWLKDLVRRDHNEYVKRDTAAHILRDWEGNPQLEPILPFVKYRNRKYVRCTVVEVIADYWNNDPDILSWLKQIAQESGYGLIRDAVLAAIVKGWKNDPNTIIWLRHLAQESNDPIVVCAVAATVAQNWKDDLDILAILKYRSQQDSEKYLRCAIVESIAQAWSENLDTLPWLKDIANNADDWHVTHAAAQVLLKGWKYDPDTLLIVKHCVQYDRNDYERCQLVKDIAQGWKNDPNTLPWLQELVQNDIEYLAIDEIIRGVKSLSQCRKYRTNIFNFLYSLAVDDPFQRQNSSEFNPRLTALRAVVKNYRDRSEVLDLLLDRSKNDPDEQVRKYAEEELVKWRSKSS